MHLPTPRFSAPSPPNSKPLKQKPPLRPDSKKHFPTPTESAAILRRAIAAELEAVKIVDSASARLKEAEAQYIAASEDDGAISTTEAGYNYVSAEQAHSTARRAHLAAIDQVKNGEAWMECHAKEAACPWTGAAPTAPQL